VAGKREEDEAEAAPSFETRVAVASAAPMAAARARANACTPKPPQSDGRTFNGTAREVPKTTVADASLENFSSIADLRKDIRAQER
jgi:hypothetical protein